MSRKPIIIAGVIAAAVGVVAAVGITGFALNNIGEEAPLTVQQPAAVEPPPTVAPDADAESGADAGLVVLRSGTFVDGDAIHRGSGTVSIVDDGEQVLLVFGDDVSITPGPDLFVYLSPNAAGEDLGEFVSLGTLTADTGAQAYVLPENVDDYQTVVIWCRAFSVTFATAELT